MREIIKSYYEQVIIWDKHLTKKQEENEKNHQVTKLIPPDTANILDVGCGNGMFINSLKHNLPCENIRLMACDFSKTALKYVETDKLLATVSSLPFKDAVFDLVISMEVLEHLPEKEYTKGLRELQRIGRKYIIITVPNKDNIKSSLTTCPSCYCKFNPCFHLRSFSDENLATIFEYFLPLKIKKIGPMVKHYRALIRPIYRLLKKKTLIETAICPQCGYQTNRVLNNRSENSSSNHLINSIKNLVKTVLCYEKRRWIVALYLRSDF